VGWGGLPQAFDETNSQWAKEYAELKELLTDEEYASARASTFNAHYTSPAVIKAMYACLENMGFKTGTSWNRHVASATFSVLSPTA